MDHPIDTAVANARILPVVIIDRAEHAVDLAQALSAGGIDVVEFTLRTEAALPAIAEVAKHCPNVVVGAGTVLNTDQLAHVLDAGAKFVATPGFDPVLSEAALAAGTHLFPGVASPGEVMQAQRLGLTRLKFFPAQYIVGSQLLKALHSPFAQVRFIPTGGIDASSAGSYFKLPNVIAVGGSWVAPRDLIAAGNFEEITKIVKQTKEQFNDTN